MENPEIRKSGNPKSPTCFRSFFFFFFCLYVESKNENMKAGKPLGKAGKPEPESRKAESRKLPLYCGSPEIGYPGYRISGYPRSRWRMRMRWRSVPLMPVGVVLILCTQLYHRSACDCMECNSNFRK